MNHPTSGSRVAPGRISADIAVIGGGPAGLSTAFHLARMAPEFTDRLVVLEAKRHPREKPCGGAVSVPGLTVLRRLGLDMPPDSLAVDSLRLRYGKQGYDLKGGPIVRIHHRPTFDAWLADSARKAGIRMHEDEPALTIRERGDCFLIETPSLRIRARVIVGADGSRGAVRRLLGGPPASNSSRLVEVVVPTSPGHELFHARAADLRFGVMGRHVQGYAWKFPFHIRGRPHLNLGVFDARIQPFRERPNLREVLEQEFPHIFRGFGDEPRLKGHPLHWFDERGELSRPGVLFVGDAAGADPLFGEGISFALEYGHVAAHQIILAFQTNDFSFREYSHRVRRNALLRDLPRRTRLARLAFGIRSTGLRRLGWSVTRPFARWIRWKSVSPGFQD